MSNFKDRIDLLRNVVPISRAASSLAALLKRAGAEGTPVVITQKGYPSGVLLSVEDYQRLVARAERPGDEPTLIEE